MTPSTRTLAKLAALILIFGTILAYCNHESDTERTRKRTRERTEQAERARTDAYREQYLAEKAEREAHLIAALDADIETQIYAAARELLDLQRTSTDLARNVTKSYKLIISIDKPADLTAEQAADIRTHLQEAARRSTDAWSREWAAAKPSIKKVHYYRTAEHMSKCNLASRTYPLPHGATLIVEGYQAARN